MVESSCSRFQAESSEGTSEQNKDSILNNLNKRAAAAKSKNIVNSCCCFVFAFLHNTSSIAIFQNPRKDRMSLPKRSKVWNKSVKS